MPGTHVDATDSTLEKAIAELIRDAVRTEVQEFVRLIRDEDRLLTIDQVAERLSVSRDWVYRNGKRLSFTRKLGPKLFTKGEKTRMASNDLQASTR